MVANIFQELCAICELESQFEMSFDRRRRLTIDSLYELKNNLSPRKVSSNASSSTISTKLKALVSKTGKIIKTSTENIFDGYDNEISPN